MPGAPTQQFQPTPWVTGIGGGLSAAEMMGMFGTQNKQAAAQQTMPVGWGNENPLHRYNVAGSKN
jgi:hypothetical protein